MNKRFYLICFLVVTLKVNSQTNFVVSSSGTNTTIDAAINHVVNIWDDYLITNVPVKLHVEYLDLTNQGPLGITLPNGRKDFPSSPIQGIWYASCLANAIEGVELNTGEHDINVFMNRFTYLYVQTPLLFLSHHHLKWKIDPSFFVNLRELSLNETKSQSLPLRSNCLCF